MMSKFAKKYWWAFVAVLIIVLDQITKYLITSNMGHGESITVIKGFFNIAYQQNTGIAFGFLDDAGTAAQIIVAVFTAVILILAVVILARKIIFHPLGVLAVGMIIGGGLGNLIDRLFRRYVVDFFGFIFWGKEFAVFNVADIFVTVGTFFFLIYFIFFDKDINNKQENNDGIQEI